MTAAARLAAAVAALLAPPPAQEEVSARGFSSAAEMIAWITEGAPAVLGFGELHQVEGTARIPSALRRFSDEIFPLLASRASDLVVETWVTDGQCGQSEAAVVQDVQRTTERPQATESEIVTLLRRAKEAGVRPHILRVSCADYHAMSAAGGAPGGAIDYQQVLSLTTRHLQARVQQVLAARPAADAGKVVIVYGGALHNDLHPYPSLAAYSYAVPVFRAVSGRYREVDLYVPEYVQRSAATRGERWYPAWKRRGRPGELTGLRRSVGSFVVVFPRTPRAAPAAPAATQR